MASSTSTDFLNNIIPGWNGLSSQTSSVIGNLLNGSPNPATAQNAAATFGVQNGQGAGSGIASRYGYDLYGQQGQQRQQTGIQDLLSYIAGVSSPTLQNQGQQLQNTQFGQQLQQSGQEFNVSQQNQQNDQMMQLLAQLGGK